MLSTVRDEIAKNLLYYRKKCNLTQKELAEKLGVKNSAVSNWENGLNSIDIDTLHLACNVFGVTVNDMYGIYANTQYDEYTSTEKEIIRNYRSLNQEGQNKISEYIDDIVSSGKYIKNYTHGVVEEKQA